MKLAKISRIVAVLAVLAGGALAGTTSADAQSTQPAPGSAPRPPLLTGVLGGPRIGASIRDLDTTDRRSGVYVDSVRPGSPAEKAGIQAADVITRFDGETVRSARQFSRLVQETSAGRMVALTVMRGNRAMDLSVTPEEARAGLFFDGQGPVFDRRQLDATLDRLREQLRNVPFDVEAFRPGARLGATLHELTPQLATYFGAKNGVLVASVADDSPAARGGLKAGDVISSVNGQGVTSPGDLTRALRRADSSADVTLTIVRDRTETSVTVKLDDGRPRRTSPRPVRPS